ncbi:MAG: DUF4159 domain-containing protein [Flavobacteriales bacterium]|nr:DUF4159 domain-containing protein [Flavobacteriales bacterium]MCW8912022.1 DUF4159 domain-containing protein [Flavobacteriales bacterium]MCW8936662.1 DUF4159 domain-containing protein [Flavobacteriales bacterium]MCW8939561.1 DUF4159 domain-containing protein [Flavobacteriales bacterium]MCW8969610.1 DUF4159 domain-containing protein [Flavobacteriales bacterium]
MRFYILFVLAAIFSFSGKTQPYSYQIALVKYNGGGDWYANLETSLPNLVKFCNKNLKTNINPEQAIVEVGSKEIFNYPFVHLTGHGNIIFSNDEAQNIRNYLIGGGFLHISDNYGLDQFIRSQLKKVFPELELVELPYNHPIYHQKYKFTNGLPKIHEHDNKPAKGLGLIYEGRLVCFYDVECDLGDGWEDAVIHNNSEENRLKALQMGANIIQYALTQ